MTLLTLVQIIRVLHEQGKNVDVFVSFYVRAN